MKVNMLFRSDKVQKVCAYSAGALICITLFFSCSQHGLSKNSMSESEAVSIKQKFDNEMMSVRWEASAFTERKLSGAKKSTVDNTEFMAVIPAEKGIYPLYPGLGVLDYSTCSADVIAAVETAGTMIADGSWLSENDVFFPDNTVLRDYYSNLQDEIPADCTVLYGTPAITNEDAFDVVYLFKGADGAAVYVTLYFLFNGTAWYVDDLSKS